MLTTIRTLLTGALRDRISLGYAIIFPLALLIGLGIAFPVPAYRQQLLAGLLSLSCLFFALNGTSFQVMAQRNRGVYKLLRATPFPVSAFVFSLTVARGVVALVGSLVVLLAGVLILGLKVSALSIALLLPVLSMGILFFTCLGFIVGNVTQKEEQVNGVANLMQAPMLFAGEVFYSLNRAPGWIRAISRINPFTYLMDATRSAFAGDAGAMLVPLLVMALFTFLALALAVLTFRWDPDSKIGLNALRQA